MLRLSVVFSCLDLCISFFSLPHHDLGEPEGNKEGQEEHSRNIHNFKPSFILWDLLGKGYGKDRNADRDKQPKQTGHIICIKITMNHVSGFVYLGTATAEPIYKKPIIDPTVRNQQNGKQG